MSFGVCIHTQVLFGCVSIHLPLCWFIMIISFFFSATSGFLSDLVAVVVFHSDVMRLMHRLIVSGFYDSGFHFGLNSTCIHPSKFRCFATAKIYFHSVIWLIIVTYIIAINLKWQRFCMYKYHDWFRMMPGPRCCFNYGSLNCAVLCVCVCVQRLFAFFVAPFQLIFYIFGFAAVAHSLFHLYSSRLYKMQITF